MPKYISPYRLLQIEPNVDIDEQMLSAARLRLVIEIELSEHQSIEINGNKLKQADVIRLFKDFSINSNLEIHHKIANHKRLLDFLEYSTIPQNGDLVGVPISAFNNGFVIYISPYFRDIYIEKLDDAFGRKDANALKNIFSLTPKFLTYDDKLLANNSINFEISKLIDYTLYFERRVMQGTEKMAFMTLKQYYQADFMYVLNRLDADFDSAKDKFAIALNNLAVELWDDKQEDAAKYIANKAIDLAVKNDTKIRINTLISTISSIGNRTSSTQNSNTTSSSGSSSSGSSSSRTGRTGSSSMGLGSIFVAVVAIIRVIMMFGECANSHKSYSPTYTPEYQYPSKAPEGVPGMEGLFSNEKSITSQDIENKIAELNIDEDWNNLEKVEDLIYKWKFVNQDFPDATEKDNLKKQWKVIKVKIVKNISSKKMPKGLKDKIVEADNIANGKITIKEINIPEPNESNTIIRNSYLKDLQKLKKGLNSNNYFVNTVMLAAIKSKYPNEIDENFNTLETIINAKVETKENVK